MLRLHDHHVEPSLLAKFNKQRGNTVRMVHQANRPRPISLMYTMGTTFLGLS